MAGDWIPIDGRGGDACDGGVRADRGESQPGVDRRDHDLESHCNRLHRADRRRRTPAARPRSGVLGPARRRWPLDRQAPI